MYQANMEGLAQYYLWIKALHIISVISWMAALFYMPRLFVYHTQVREESEAYTLFKTMERRLEKIIMTPAMVASLFFGVLLLVMPGIVQWQMGWIHGKLFLVFLLLTYHVLLVKYRKAFACGRNTRKQRFYRSINEIPVVIKICIVILAVVKPF